MTSQLGVVTSLFIGASTLTEAAEALDVPINEVKRLTRALGDESAKLVPVSVDIGARRFEFLDLQGLTCHEPIFAETIRRAKRDRPNALNFEVDFADFTRAAECHQRPPDGFLFHVGRCGSTLLVNMLSASGGHLVIKEPDLVSDLIAGWLSAPDEATRVEIELLLPKAIRYLLSAAGAAVGANIRYRVLKLTAWNIRLANVLLGSFPTTPAVFLYRSPIETVASLLFHPPAWFELIGRPRATQALFFPSVRDVPEGATLSACTFFAHAWRSTASAALTLPPERLHVMRYEELIGDAEAAIHRVLAHLDHSVALSIIELMAATRMTYSKDPTHRALFKPQGEHCRPPLSPEQANDVWVITGACWHRLEERARLAAPVLEEGGT